MRLYSSIKQHSSLSSAGYIYIYRTQKALQEMSFDRWFAVAVVYYFFFSRLYSISEKKGRKKNLKALKSKRLEINLLPRHWSHMLLLSTGLFRWQIFFLRAPHLYNLIDLLCMCTYSYLVLDFSLVIHLCIKYSHSSSEYAKIPILHSSSRYAICYINVITIFLRTTERSALDLKSGIKRMETIQQSVTCHVNCYRRRNSIQTLLYKSKSKLPTHTSTLHTHHGLLIPSPSHSHLNGVEILRRRQLDFPESVGNGNDDHFFVFTSIRNDARAAGVLRSIYFLLQLHLYIILYRYVRV